MPLGRWCQFCLACIDNFILGCYKEMNINLNDGGRRVEQYFGCCKMIKSSEKVGPPSLLGLTFCFPVDKWLKFDRDKRNVRMHTQSGNSYQSLLWKPNRAYLPDGCSIIDDQTEVLHLERSATDPLSSHGIADNIFYRQLFYKLNHQPAPWISIVSWTLSKWFIIFFLKFKFLGDSW